MCQCRNYALFEVRLCIILYLLLPPIHFADSYLFAKAFFFRKQMLVTVVGVWNYKAEKVMMICCVLTLNNQSEMLFPLIW